MDGREVLFEYSVLAKLASISSKLLTHFLTLYSDNQTIAKYFSFPF